MADLSIPSEKDAKKMRAEMAEKRQQKEAGAAYEKSRVYPDTPPSPPTVNKKKGGSVRGHGCETKGKTKGKFV
jgi:hypothetical protein